MVGFVGVLLGDGAVAACVVACVDVAGELTGVPWFDEVHAARARHAAAVVAVHRIVARTPARYRDGSASMLPATSSPVEGAVMRHPYVWLLCLREDRRKRQIDSRPVAVRRADGVVLSHPTSNDSLAVRDHLVAVEGGAIRVRTYRPRSAEALPAHLLLHGGGFWTGAIENVDSLARLYAVRANCVVVSVDYRLAPEHPWPTGIEDAYVALRWVVAEADELGVDAARLSVGGISAGGCIAAVLAMIARDRGGPSLRFMLLEVPVTDLTMSATSLQTYAEGYRTTAAELAECYDFYLPDVERRREAYASPLLAEDLSGLPSAFVLTCEYDLLRDEGAAFAERLREAGSPIQHVQIRGHVHGSTYTTTIASARASHELTADALRAALHG